jgi:hypothetical protein
MRMKDHFYVSSTGFIFILIKSGKRWYLVGDPIDEDSRMLWTVGSSLHFTKISKYVTRQLGLTKLR